jgi:hypothetical protein
MANLVDRLAPAFVLFVAHAGIAILLIPFPYRALLWSSMEDAVQWLTRSDAPEAIDTLSLPVAITTILVFVVSHYLGLNPFTNLSDIEIDLLIMAAGSLKTVALTIAAIVTSISATYSNWTRQGHYRVIRFMVLVPGLIFAMFVNAVMYILFFLPITCLATIWDYFVVEHTTEIGNSTGGDGEGAETISELDLNDCGDGIPIKLQVTLLGYED